MTSEIIHYLNQQGLDIPREHYELLNNRWKDLQVNKQKIPQEKFKNLNIFLQPISRSYLYE